MTALFGRAFKNKKGQNKDLNTFENKIITIKSRLSFMDTLNWEDFLK